MNDEKEPCAPWVLPMMAVGVIVWISILSICVMGPEICAEAQGYGGIG